MFCPDPRTVCLLPVNGFAPGDVLSEQVCFWDLKSGERRVKQHRDLKLICGSGEHVCLVKGPDDKGRYGIKIYSGF